MQYGRKRFVKKTISNTKRIAKVISLIETIYSAYKEIIENNKAGVYEDNPQAMNNPKIGEAIKKVEISL